MLLGCINFSCNFNILFYEGSEGFDHCKNYRRVIENIIKMEGYLVSHKQKTPGMLGFTGKDNSILTISFSWSV